MAHDAAFGEGGMLQEELVGEIPEEGFDGGGGFCGHMDIVGENKKDGNCHLFGLSVNIFSLSYISNKYNYFLFINGINNAPITVSYTIKIIISR